MNSWHDIVRSRVAEYKIAECRNKLDRFGRMPYSYKGKSLFVDYRDGLAGDHAQGKLILADSKSGKSIVPLSPDICGSFAIWPPNNIKGKGSNLFDICNKDEVLRPQFVFLALNWSSKITLAANRINLDSPRDYFSTMPMWNNFHNLSKDTPKHKKSHLEESFEDNPLRGAYMTDFAKGIVATDSTGVYKFLRDKHSEINGLDVCPFMGYVEILREELKALDEAFGNPDIPKYLIVYGPTLYNNLQSMAWKYKRKSLDELFPDRTILRTGSFYNNVHGLTVKGYHEQLRQLFYPPLAGPVRVTDLKFKRIEFGRK